MSELQRTKAGCKSPYFLGQQTVADPVIHTTNHLLSAMGSSQYVLNVSLRDARVQVTNHV